jgi:hypothetical protein
MLRRMLAQTLFSIAVLAVMLFLPAGTLDWPQGWALIVLFVGCSQVTGLWLMRTDPELLAARMKSPLSSAQKSSDRAVMAVIFVVFCLWLIFMPLDARRFGWSHTPWWTQGLGALLFEGLPGYREYSEKVRFRLLPGLW